MRLHRDERGLVGKLLILWLLVLALVVVAAIDAGSILLASVHVRHLAQDAATAGAERLDEAHPRRAALRAALGELADLDRDARLDRFELPASDEVAVTVSDRTRTLLVGRFGLFENLTRVSASSTRRAPDG